MTIQASCGHVVECFHQVQNIYVIYEVYEPGHYVHLGLKKKTVCPECYAYYIAINDPYVAFTEDAAWKLITYLEEE